MRSSALLEDIIALYPNEHGCVEITLTSRF